MPVKAKMMNPEQNYEELFRDYDNEQLNDVLKKRKLYQDEAAKAAINEAIHRELISSEEDLYGKEFSHEPLKTRLFPLIESPEIRNKIRKSLARGFLLAGLLPIIWGIVRFNAGFNAEGVLVIASGICWMGCSVILMRSFSSHAILLLSLLLIISAGYIIRWFIVSPSIAFMDAFIVAVLFLLMVYGLLFLKRLEI